MSVFSGLPLPIPSALLDIHCHGGRLFDYEDIKLMLDKDFIRKRISVFLDKEDVDPTVDKEVAALLKSKLSIYLPQRSSFDDSLASTTSDHEILDLIIQYRALVNQSNFTHKATDGLSPPPPYAQY